VSLAVHRSHHAFEATDAALNFATVISTALMMWKGLAVLTNCESPIVVVLSGSMEPAFRRGDLLFLHLPRKEPLRVGDITVCALLGVRDVRMGLIR
jgi:signal peptidase